MNLCVVCDEKPAWATERCRRCYSFFQRHGVNRPTDFTRKRRILVCTVCESRPAKWGPRCGNCAQWFSRHKTERPKNFAKPVARMCSNCDLRKAFAGGRCKRCYDWHRSHRSERPKALDSQRESVTTPKEKHIPIVFYKPIPGYEWKSWWQGA